MTTPQLNRADRRALAKAAKRKPAPRRAMRNKLAPINLLGDAAQYVQGGQAASHLVTRACLERLLDGSADTDDYDRVAHTINLAQMRARSIDAGLAAQLEQAQYAVQRCQERYLAHGRFGFDGPGLVMVREAIDAAEAIIDASTPLQMHKAGEAVLVEMFGKAEVSRRMEHAKALELRRA